MKGRGEKRTAVVRQPVAGGDLPDYRNPPVSEVACGVNFQPLKQFLLPHVGLFWGRIRKDYPLPQHAAPLSTATEPAWIDPVTELPLPRVWFISPDKAGLVQLQGDCLYYNWRRLSDDNVYPRYRSVIARYKQLVGEFLAFLEENGIPPPAVTGCELTYVNHIPSEQGWTSPADLYKVFRDYCWTGGEGRFLPDPKNVSWKVQYPIDENNGTLTVAANSAVRVRDQMPTMKLELSAKLRMNEKSINDTWRWFDVAHEWIVRGFGDLTQSDFQKTAWQRTNG
jgi:uncharacterized protein (TIGR04255 family)